jgi:hypothetical protein
MREPKGIRIMYVTATQPRIEHIQRETNLSAHAEQAIPRQTITLLASVFMEEHGIGRLEELAETPDFPLDFQI